MSKTTTQTREIHFCNGCMGPGQFGTYGKEQVESCGLCQDCGSEMEHRYLPRRCKDCRNKLKIEVFLDNLAKAKDVTDTYDGMVYFDDPRISQVSYDGWYEDDPEMILDMLYEPNEDFEPDENGQVSRIPDGIPEELWGWACQEQRIDIDPERILEHACEDMYEDAYDHLTGVDEFIKFVMDWKNAQGVVSYYPDYTRKIRIR